MGLRATKADGVGVSVGPTEAEPVAVAVFVAVCDAHLGVVVVSISELDIDAVIDNVAVAVIDIVGRREGLGESEAVPVIVAIDDMNPDEDDNTDDDGDDGADGVAFAEGIAGPLGLREEAAVPDVDLDSEADIIGITVEDTDEICGIDAVTVAVIR